MHNKIRLIAFYLPQYHPIPENDEWWGKGFTEWTNTAKAKPMFRGHYQPHVPADLGFYDLRLPEVRDAQALMAKQYGVEAFCYYHYWFAGKRILEQPFNAVLASGKPDFPFCLCWANETWTGIWHDAPKRILIEQTYPGIDDHCAHFEYLLGAFKDSRYLKVNGKPLFIIYQPWAIPNITNVLSLWRDLAAKAGLKGLHIVAVYRPLDEIIPNHGFDAFMPLKFPSKNLWVSRRYPVKWLCNQFKLAYRRHFKKPAVYNYSNVFLETLNINVTEEINYPCVVPNWDNTPRCRENGLVLHNSSPHLFKRQLEKALQIVNLYEDEEKIVFLKSWNEWAEGNHVEPDLKFGHAYLKAIRDVVME